MEESEVQARELAANFGEAKSQVRCLGAACALHARCLHAACALATGLSVSTGGPLLLPSTRAVALAGAPRAGLGKPPCPLPPLSLAPQPHPQVRQPHLDPSPTPTPTPTPTPPQITKLQALSKQAAGEAARKQAVMEADYKAKLGLAMAEIKALSRSQMEVGEKLEEVQETYSSKLQAVVEQVRMGCLGCLGCVGCVGRVGCVMRRACGVPGWWRAAAAGCRQVLGPGGLRHRDPARAQQGGPRREAAAGR
jgi:hypothetical protein